MCALQALAGERACYQSCVVHDDKLYLLGMSTVFTVSLHTWQDVRYSPLLCFTLLTLQLHVPSWKRYEYCTVCTIVFFVQLGGLGYAVHYTVHVQSKYCSKLSCTVRVRVHESSLRITSALMQRVESLLHEDKYAPALELCRSIREGRAKLVVGLRGSPNAKRKLISSKVCLCRGRLLLRRFHCTLV